MVLSQCGSLAAGIIQFGSCVGVFASLDCWIYTSVSVDTPSVGAYNHCDLCIIHTKIIIRQADWLKIPCVLKLERATMGKRWALRCRSRQRVTETFCCIRSIPM
jgi:hypothetical protein